MAATKPMLAILFLLGFVSVSTAHGQNVACMGLSELKEEVFSCSSNTTAAQKAMQCYDQVMKNWEDASKELGKLMEKAKKESAQNKLLSTMNVDFKNALTKIDAETESMQKNTELISSYPLAMVEYFPGIMDPREPYCFQRPHQKILAITADLKKQIAVAKKLREQTSSFYQATKNAGSNLKGSVVEKLPPARPTESKKPAIQKSGKAQNSGSDITGSQKAAADKKKADEVLRGK